MKIPMHFRAFRRQLWLPCLALAALLLPAVSSAQSRGADAERWFQVELIVFEQGGNPADSEELWRSDIELGYPRNWLELVEPEDSSTTESDTTWETAPEAPALDDAESREQALTLLAADELTMRNEADRLSRSSQYRILFHGGWRQALTENNQEPSILITGGEEFDDHYELEGSIQLSLRTYLHLDTNLWLTRFNTSFGQERAAWPKLPRRPNQPIDTDFLFQIDNGNSELWHQFNQSWDYDTIFAQPYVVENIVRLTQSRRMRSGEIHYIDHPQMGLLIKLTPYEHSTEKPINR